MANLHHKELLFIGETVTLSYVADPVVGHGQFRLENHGTDAVMATIKSAWLERGGQQQPIDSVTLFDLNQDQMINPENFKVAADATFPFLVGFPQVAYEPRPGESCAVILQVSINDIVLEASSPIKFVRRIPYRH